MQRKKRQSRQKKNTHLSPPINLKGLGVAGISVKKRRQKGGAVGPGTSEETVWTKGGGGGGAVGPGTSEETVWTACRMRGVMWLPNDSSRS